MRKTVQDTPYLLVQWDRDLNKDISPQQTTVHSHKKVWWKCDKGHSYQMRIDDKSQGKQCYKCEKKEEKIENNILRTHSDIAKLWDYEKNLSYHSRKCIFWKWKNGMVEM